MTQAATLKVCIDARLHGGKSGGVETVLLGLAAGLGALTDGDEEYLFLAWEDAHDWLAWRLGGNSRLLGAGAAPQSLVERSPAWVRRAWRRLSPLLGPLAVPVAASDGRVEASGAAVMHFPKQDAFVTALPSIYHPHDLQHLHLPELFTPRERLKREIRYRRFCAEAKLVVTSSEWARQDILHHYALAASKVASIPLAPILGDYPKPEAADVEGTRRRLGLPDAFFFYPAQTWPHKNHLMLLEAAARVRAGGGPQLAFVFAGHETEHAVALRTRAQLLGLLPHVLFVGFVPPLALACLYRLCRAVVIPSLFEAASFPLWEAFQSGCAAACSNVTSLPEQAGDAALVFDPCDVDDVARTLVRLWTDGELRAQLALRGRVNVDRFSWQRTARILRAHYRRLAGRDLCHEDRALLAAPALL